MSLGWRRTLLGAFLVALLAFVAFSETGYTTLLRALATIEGIAATHPGWAAGLVVLFAAVAAMVAFLSSWLIVPFAVYTWGTAGALLLLWVGWLVGGVASYAMGRFLGRPVIQWLGFAPLLARYEERVSRRSPLALVFLFQLALPSEVRGQLFGFVRYGFGRYLLTFGLAELAHGIATVFLGAGVVERRITLVLAIASALVLLTVWASYALHRCLAGERDAGGVLVRRGRAEQRIGHEESASEPQGHRVACEGALEGGSAGRLHVQMGLSRVPRIADGADDIPDGHALPRLRHHTPRAQMREHDPHASAFEEHMIARGELDVGSAGRIVGAAPCRRGNPAAARAVHRRAEDLVVFQRARENAPGTVTGAAELHQVDRPATAARGPVERVEERAVAALDHQDPRTAQR